MVVENVPVEVDKLLGVPWESQYTPYQSDQHHCLAVTMERIHVQRLGKVSETRYTSNTGFNLYVGKKHILK